MARQLRVPIALLALALVAAVTPAGPAAGGSGGVVCEGRDADYLAVTGTSDGAPLRIEGTPGRDDLVIDIRGSFDEVIIETYAGADTVCVTNGGASDLRIDVDRLDVRLGGGNDRLVVVSPATFRLDVTTGNGNDIVVAPVPLFERGSQNSNWSDTGGLGDRLRFLPMAGCGVHIGSNGEVSPTTGAGSCGSSSVAVRALEDTLPLTAAFIASLVGAGLVAPTALGLMFDYILGRIITIRDAGVDVSGFEYIEGTPGDDVIEYAGRMRIVWGHDGDDVIYMNETTERVLGGRGDDVIHVADVNYVYVNAGSGTDMVRFDGDGEVQPTHGVTVNLDAEQFAGGFTSPAGVGSAGTLRSVEDVITTPFADVVTGTVGANFIRTRQGVDFIDALAGNDTVEAGSNADTVYAGQGHDVVSAGAGRDLVWAGPGNDTVYGGTANDTLYGEDGDDELRAVAIDEAPLAWRITSQEGNDVLSGGDGDDICDQGGADTTSGCELQHLRDFGPALYTRQIQEGGFPVLQIEAPWLTTSGHGTRSGCAVNGRIRARLPGFVAEYSDIEPTQVQTTVTRTSLSASSPQVTVLDATTQTDTALSTASASVVAWVRVRTDRDATYEVEHDVSNNYHDFTQPKTFTGRLDCNTAGISASASDVADNGTVALDVNGETGGLAYDWSVDRGSGWGFVSGNASSKAPTMVFTAPGTYVITLTATTPLGRVLTDTHTVTVAANQPPTADAGSDAELTSGSTYRLNGSGTDPDGDNLSYHWTKPAGVTWFSGSSSSMRPTAQFTANGIYTFTLQVCDASACDTDSMQVVVSSLGGPV